jgi:hypothetical protein
VAYTGERRNHRTIRKSREIKNKTKNKNETTRASCNAKTNDEPPCNKHRHPQNHPQEQAAIVDSPLRPTACVAWGNCSQRLSGRTRNTSPQKYSSTTEPRQSLKPTQQDPYTAGGGQKRPRANLSEQTTTHCLPPPMADKTITDDEITV